MCRVPPVHRRGQMWDQVVRGVHECQMRERLREVPEQPLLGRVVLLREQADVVREADETIEERTRVVVAAQQLVAVDEPERTGQKDSFTRRKAVDAGVRAIAEDEAVVDELALDRLDGAPN